MKHEGVHQNIAYISAASSRGEVKMASIYC